MAVFVEVARQNGFRAAAESLNLQPGSVSEAVQRFEDRLGVRLLERTTRSIALTSIGEQLYARCVPAMNELESALQDVHEQRDSISGTLRLSAPYSAGTFFLDDLVSRFAIAFPDINVEVIYDDRKIDLATGQVDAAIRSDILLESDSHAVAVGPPLVMALVASPSYLDRMGTPQHPHDIVEHDGICFAFGDKDRLAPWIFKRSNKTYTVMPKPRIVANDLRSLHMYARQSLGLAYIYKEICESSLEGGQLVEVLRGNIPPQPRYSLNYLSKKHMTRRLRAFIDLAKRQTKKPASRAKR